jgi:hypothetical protein
MVYADTSSATLQLTFNVPIVCIIKNSKPNCNLNLQQLSTTKWIDLDGHYEVYLINNQLTVITLN